MGALKDVPAAKDPGITHLANYSLYISYEEEIFLMIQVVKTFIKNDCKSVPFHANFSDRHARVAVHELHAGYLEQSEERLPPIPQFVETKVQQT